MYGMSIVSKVQIGILFAFSPFAQLHWF